MKAAAIALEHTINEFLTGKAQVITWNDTVTAGKWNNKDIIGHLIDSGHINLQRFIRCTYEENFKLIYFQDEWVTAQHYKTADIEELLKLWELLNRQIIRVLKNSPPGRALVKCDNGRYETSLHTIEFIATDYVEHMKHHLNQIRG
ncbi:DinB family protein [Mucilaginibacter conchicola]|uniref:DinB family protein n=1 Tax=Mucilaginibacter conchicola TaxID=2303333 RepID=A0A372NVZ7_9SPHI|nr:DinB family protein [Mucilaginibacter conchicola]RFZ94275.1 DinB family protein [Mucilaginibacter conchicola]